MAKEEAANQEIESELKRVRDAQQSELRILFLGAWGRARREGRRLFFAGLTLRHVGRGAGAGEVGKTTLMKQLRHKHADAFSDVELACVSLLDICFF